MGTFSIWHWVVVAVVILLLFGGRGKLSGLMGDAAKGITAFRKGLKEGSDDPKPEQETPKTIEADATAAVADDKKKDKAANG